MLQSCKKYSKLTSLLVLQGYLVFVWRLSSLVDKTEATVAPLIKLQRLVAGYHIGIIFN